MHDTIERVSTFRMRLYLAILAVILVLLVGVFSSGATQWYLHYPYFDKAMHLAGGFVIAWVAAVLFVKDLQRISLAGALLLLVGSTLVIGIGWEVAEYASNTYFIDATEGWKAVAWRYFHGGDLGDTLLDLGADTVGALVLAGLFLPVARRRTSETTNE